MAARTLTINEALDAGTDLAMRGRHQDAIGLFRSVLTLEPSNFEAMERLGTSLFELKRVHEAFYWFWRGLKAAPKHPLALTNYGMALSELGHADEGIHDLERAVARARKSVDLSDAARALILNNYGNTLEKVKRHPQALAALDECLRYSPNDAFAHYNRGIVLLRLGRETEAIDALDHAIALDPGNADAYYNRGMARLKLGNLADGFPDYEYRLLTSENAKTNFGLPPAKRWIGAQEIAGKTILLHCEQGLGDDIQFFRFIEPLLELAPKRIKMIGHAATAVLLPQNPLIEVLQPGDDLGDYDYWVALMSLPYCFGLGHELEIPFPFMPTLESEELRRWREALAHIPEGEQRVGFVWAGNFRHKNDANRSIPLAKFVELFDGLDGVHAVSLQQVRGEDAERLEELRKEARFPLTILKFDDFRDTAAAIANLDVVVSVDTAVAHLAASLGIRTIILLPEKNTDWRWQLKREDSPWYPAARLVRQSGDWTSALAQARALI